MFCKRENHVRIITIQQNDKSTQLSKCNLTRTHVHMYKYTSNGMCVKICICILALLKLHLYILILLAQMLMDLHTYIHFTMCCKRNFLTFGHPKLKSHLWIEKMCVHLWLQNVCSLLWITMGVFPHLESQRSIHNLLLQRYFLTRVGSNVLYHLAWMFLILFDIMKV